jgi:predicted permease
MDFITSLAKMSVVLAAIAAGYLANKLGYLGGEVDRKLTKVILNITMPAMTLGAVATSAELPGTRELVNLLEGVAVFYGMALLLAMLLPRLIGGTKAQQSVWRFALSFPNVGFIGIPVVTAFFGPEAVIYAVIVMLPFNVLSYALGPVMLSGGFRNFSVRKLFTPAVVASVAALVMTLFRLRPPVQVGECLNIVGDITAPLSLMVIGSILAGLPIGRVFASPRLWVLTALRLIALPVLLRLLLQPLGMEELALSVAIVEMAMPVAANGSMLCMEYGGDMDTMAQATFLTTLLSMVTVPLMVTVLL